MAIDDGGTDVEPLNHREPAGRHRGDADHRADREIDATRDDHDRLAQREERDQRNVAHVVAQVVPAQKLGLRSAVRQARAIITPSMDSSFFAVARKGVVASPQRRAFVSILDVEMVMWRASKCSRR